jgi:hypothetical protein
MTESSINTERILINHFIYNLKITIIYLLNKYAHKQDELLSGVNMMIDMFLSSIWLINGISLLISFMESRMSKKQVSFVLLGFILLLLLLMKKRA